MENVSGAVSWIQYLYFPKRWRLLSVFFCGSWAFVYESGIFSLLLGADWGISGVGARVVLSLMIHVPLACCAAKWHVAACTQYLRYIGLALQTCTFAFISEVVPPCYRFAVLQLVKAIHKLISGIFGSMSAVPSALLCHGFCVGGMCCCSALWRDPGAGQRGHSGALLWAWWARPAQRPLPYCPPWTREL